MLHGSSGALSLLRKSSALFGCRVTNALDVGSRKSDCSSAGLEKAKRPRKAWCFSGKKNLAEGSLSGISNIDVESVLVEVP